MCTERQPRAGRWVRRAGAALAAVLLATAPLAAQELIVGEGGTHATITAALRAAPAGARITVLPGVYREGTLNIDRRVELVGRGMPVLDGEGEHTVVHVSADGVAIRGFEIRNAGVSFVSDNAGIYFDDVTGCTVEGNRLRHNFFGVYLARSRDCAVVDNDIAATGTREATSGNGIHLWYSSGTRIEGNTIRGHRDGIYLEYAERTRITGNTSEGNLRYGLHFMFSGDSDYEGNVFRRNGAGVAVMYSKGVRMSRNLFEDNRGTAAYGLLLKDISDSEIRNNVFLRNTVGIFSDGSIRVVVDGNRFQGNGWAARVFASSHENRFTNNDFVDNTFDVSTNSRRNFNTFDGNYWSRYRGYDLTGDGYGDVPHRPVRLFSLIVQRNQAALVLMRSLFVDLLDLAERVMPVLTPETLVDERPRMREARP
jgi:nitrous oxidase accessory protein